MKFKETVIRITHVEYWKHTHMGRHIQCSSLVPDTRCPHSSIGSYLEIYEEQGKEYAQNELIFFCENHTPILIQKALTTMSETIEKLNQERNTV